MFFGVFKDREVIENDMTQNQTNQTDLLEDYGNYLDDPNKNNIDLVPLSSFKSSYTEEINSEEAKTEPPKITQPFPFDNNINNSSIQQMPNRPPQNLPPIMPQPIPYPNYNMQSNNNMQNPYNMNRYPNMQQAIPQNNINAHPRPINISNNQGMNPNINRSTMHNGNFQQPIQQQMAPNFSQPQNKVQNLSNMQQNVSYIQTPRGGTYSNFLPNIEKMQDNENTNTVQIKKEDNKEQSSMQNNTNDTFDDYINSLNNQVNNRQVPLMQNNIPSNSSFNVNPQNNILFSYSQSPLPVNQNQIQENVRNISPSIKNKDIALKNEVELFSDLNTENFNNADENEIKKPKEFVIDNINQNQEENVEFKDNLKNENISDNEVNKIEQNVIREDNKSEGSLESYDTTTEEVEILDIDDNLDEKDISNTQIEEIKNDETTDKIDENKSVQPFERINSNNEKVFDNKVQTPFVRIDNNSDSKPFERTDIQTKPIINPNVPTTPIVNIPSGVTQLPISQVQQIPVTTPIILPSIVVQNQELNNNENNDPNEIAPELPYNNYINPEIPIPEIKPVQNIQTVQQPIEQNEKQFSIPTNQDIAPGYKACPKCGQVMRDDYKLCFVCGTYF